MPFSTEKRAALIALMPELGPGQASDSVLSMVRDSWLAALDEVGADPGFDKVRAALIRVMRTHLAEDDDVRRALERAVEVVNGFPEEVAEGGATLLLSRHPAWVGLSALELCAWNPSLAKDPFEWAVTLAGAGFQTLAGKGAAGRGEVLWALAEEALEVGWTDLGRLLLDAASRGPFADPDHATQVRFLLALRRLDDGEAGAEDLLEEIAMAPDAGARTVTHARHVLGELRAQAQDFEAARYWLALAAESVDPDENPAAAERIQAELANLESDFEHDPDTGDAPRHPGRPY